MEQKNKHVTTEDGTTEITDTKNRAKGIKYDGEDGGGAVYSAYSLSLFKHATKQQKQTTGNIHIWSTMGINVSMCSSVQSLTEEVFPVR